MTEFNDPVSPHHKDPVAENEVEAERYKLESRTADDGRKQVLIAQESPEWPEDRAVAYDRLVSAIDQTVAALRYSRLVLHF